MWMEREIQKSDFVLLVFTDTYLRRAEGREIPGKGRGACWESTLIYNLLNETDPTVQKFIPIFLACMPQIPSRFTSSGRNHTARLPNSWRCQQRSAQARLNRMLAERGLDRNIRSTPTALYSRPQLLRRPVSLASEALPRHLSLLPSFSRILDLSRRTDRSRA
jgi:hypothetical protein